MIISIIVATDRKNVIGRHNKLPWHLPADMRYFRQKTTGHCVVTGRKNYDSIPEKFKPLPDRTNIVITRNTEVNYPGAIVVHSLEDAIAEAIRLKEKELFIIGGGEIFRQALPMTDKIYLTKIDHELTAMFFFPTIDEKRVEGGSAGRYYAPDERTIILFPFPGACKKTITLNRKDRQLIIH
jgi:dihydrofolate reductase